MATSSIATPALVASIACLLLKSTLAAQGAPSPLEFQAIGDLYQGEVYAAPPMSPARLVLYQGEVLPLALTVANIEERPHPVHANGLARERRFRLVSYGPEGALPVAQLRLLNDGRPLGQRPGVPDDTFEIPGRTILEWRATATLQPNLPPGLYQIEVLPELRGDPRPAGHPPAILNMTTMVEFELRSATTLSDQVEILRRRADRAVQAEDPTRGLRELDRLLELYPTSYWAYETRGDIFEEQGDSVRALQQYQLAQQILTEDQDRLWAAPRDERGLVVDRVSGKVRRLQR